MTAVACHFPRRILIKLYRWGFYEAETLATDLSCIVNSCIPKDCESSYESQIMWRFLVVGFVAVGIVGLLSLRGGTQLMADTGASPVEKFIASISATAQRERKTEMDLSAEAATVFLPGRPVAEYDPDLRRLGFTRNDVIFKGQNVAIYSKTTYPVGVFGNYETRVIFYLSRDGEIKSVGAKYFFHTL